MEMSQQSSVSAPDLAAKKRPDLIDPLAARMLGPGGSHRLVEADVAGHKQQLFDGASRNLAGLYHQAMQFGDRLMVVQDDLQLTFAETFARAAALADVLGQRYRVTRGTRVAVVMANH